MSYEDKIRFKHAVEDALEELIFYASLLSDRELELAIAKLGDAEQRESDPSAKEHLGLKALILDYVRKLRLTSESKQNKAKRALFSFKTSTVRREIAEHHMKPAQLAYDKELRKLNEKNRKKRERYIREKESWMLEVEKLSLLDRLFCKPPRPVPPILKQPESLPPTLRDQEGNLSNLDFGGLLVERILIHIIPSIEIAREFATQENVRSYDVRLLAKVK